ncbi:lysophospholipid transporter LplT [Undibacterium cyanobacteriorum]|uniref:Lysophospholipid transporter LplT n=1 Tax=Undibacterium cyanobacteriorum TaxID=3073561 RepID=A0ABY9RM23_9BURK|nr:lysophospholipid transporter LplT [Undibacterium sp. 20NA77.5]WMW82267.1 lysophospholipid transporter LplT [Undibacterium sp. 20NA77.5]
MKRGFYTIMAAQFFSSLADNALLIAAMALLTTMNEPAWMTPLLKWSFALSYVLLAAFVGAFADSMPKGRVMFITNLIKVGGCGLMFFDVHPVIAYGIVGFGAAAYSPAKYGILTELLPAEKLVAANGWIEGLTIGSIILGVLLGGKLIDPHISTWILSFDFPVVDTGIDTTNEAALCVITSCYLIAALFNRHIPDTGAVYPKQERNPFCLLRDFTHCSVKLWKDKLGQISLAVTTLFWGAGAVLQLLVLEWARVNLHMPLEKGTELQGVFALGIALGALLAAKFIPLKRSLSVMKLGVMMGLVVTSMVFVKSVWLAYPLLIFIGGLAGFFVVPMNALLQHRGHVLMSAGHSIAVQNFNEQLSILVTLAIYSFMVKQALHTSTIIIAFGVFVASTTYLVMRKHASNQAKFDSVALIGEEKH